MKVPSATQLQMVPKHADIHNRKLLLHLQKERLLIDCIDYLIDDHDVSLAICLSATVTVGSDGKTDTVVRSAVNTGLPAAHTDDHHKANMTNAHLFPYKDEAQRVVDELTKEVDASTLLHHPFLQCYSRGGYKNMTVATREFALNHYAYSRNFLKYLQSVKDKLAA
eukprot:gene38877-47290_t